MLPKRLPETIEPFISLSSGGRMYPLGPNPDDILIEDIAHALANLCRYNGHTSEFWSVAAHSIEVCDRLAYAGHEDAVCFAGLMHDASEAFLQDVPRPMKSLFVGYRQWEENLEFAIAKKFGVPFPYPPVVDVVDKDMVFDELYHFFPIQSAAWQRCDLATRILHQAQHGKLPGPLFPLGPKAGKDKFLARFRCYAPSEGSV